MQEQCRTGKRSVKQKNRNFQLTLCNNMQVVFGRDCMTQWVQVDLFISMCLRLIDIKETQCRPCEWRKRNFFFVFDSLFRMQWSV